MSDVGEHLKMGREQPKIELFQNSLLNIAWPRASFKLEVKEIVFLQKDRERRLTK